jgi:tetratricopeptide (TPR) repeat protein
LPAFVFAPQSIKAQTVQPQAENINAVENVSAPKSANEKSEETKPTSKEIEEIKLPENATARDYFNTAIDLSKKGDKQKAKEFFETAIKMSPEDFPLHAKAFYNIGNIDYVEAKHSLATADTAESIAQKVAQTDSAINMAMSQGAQLLEQGTPLLKQEQEALKKAKTDEEKKNVMKTSPLKNQQFQQQLKQGI